MFGNKDTEGVFLMPKKVLKYAAEAKKTELKVLLYLFADMEGFSVEKAAAELNETAESITNALSFWRGAGIICEMPQNTGTAADKAVDEEKKASATVVKPSERGYSTLEIARARKDDKDFSSLVAYVESVTGELLNSSKQGDLLYLYDNLGMQCDVIMGIVAHCVSEDKRKIRYIAKTAEGIHNDGVRSYRELEHYFAAKKSYKEYSSFVKKLIGAGDRAFTPSEEKIVKRWESEICVSRELVEYAYEKNIGAISKPSIPYMSKIIDGWVKDGIKSVEQAKAASESNSENNKNAGSEMSRKAKEAGFDIDLEDIFEKP